MIDSIHVPEHYSLTDNINVEKREHRMWRDWKRMKERLGIAYTSPYINTPIVGQYQYIYTKDKIRISLVELPNYFHDGIDFWEICGGGLTEDCERFDSKEEAEIRIKELLE